MTLVVEVLEFQQLPTVGLQALVEASETEGPVRQVGSPLAELGALAGRPPA
ncbi:hypothetical protein ACFL5O_08060 [Myxococcota bacterium]